MADAPTSSTSIPFGRRTATRNDRAPYTSKPDDPASNPSRPLKRRRHLSARRLVSGQLAIGDLLERRRARRRLKRRLAGLQGPSLLTGAREAEQRDQHAQSEPNREEHERKPQSCSLYCFREKLRGMRRRRGTSIPACRRTFPAFARAIELYPTIC